MLTTRDGLTAVSSLSALSLTDVLNASLEGEYPRNFLCITAGTQSSPNWRTANSCTRNGPIHLHDTMRWFPNSAFPTSLCHVSCPQEPSFPLQPSFPPPSPPPPTLCTLQRGWGLCRFAWFAPRTEDYEWLGLSPSLLEPYLHPPQLSPLGTLYLTPLDADSVQVSAELAVQEDAGWYDWEDTCSSCWEDAPFDGGSLPYHCLGCGFAHASQPRRRRS